MTYYFIAMSGGDDNTRIKNKVAVPAGSAGSPNTHEFSGVIDISGMLAKDASGKYIASAGNGHSKRVAEAKVPIDEKMIAFGLQAHSINQGVISALRGDRGGQVYAYKPSSEVKQGRRRLTRFDGPLHTADIANKKSPPSTAKSRWTTHAKDVAEDMLDEVAFLTRAD